MRKRLRSSSQARPVFDSLNDLGSTPWIINKSMLKELIRAFDFSFKSQNKEILKILSIPMHSSTFHVPTVYEYFNCKNVSNVPSKEWFEFSKKQHGMMKER
jgi:DNA-directed RNA polymerase